MLKKNIKYLRVALVVVLSIILLATPAMAGVVGVNIASKSASLKYNELSNADKDILVKQALDNKDVKKLMEKLADNKVKITDTKAAKWDYAGKQGHVLIMYLSGSKDMQIVYTDSNGVVKLGAGIFKKNDGNKVVEVYDVVDGNIYNTSTIEWNGNKSNIDWKEGPLATKLSASKNIATSLSWDNCTICNYICGVIVYGGGCGLTGYFLCTSACAPIGTFSCPIICAIIYGIICGTGSFINCPDMCASLGYC